VSKTPPKVNEPQSHNADRKPVKKSTNAEESLSKFYRPLFREQVSPRWIDDKNCEYSLEQPSPFKIVPSVTTNGISETPIIR
jgi:hypothetical protein